MAEAKQIHDSIVHSGHNVETVWDQLVIGQTQCGLPNP